MCNNFSFDISNAVSEARLTPYGYGNQPDAAVTGLYLWNIAISESLYPVLNSLEIVLRNSIHNAITKYKSDELWFDSILTGSGPEQLAEAKRRLREDNKDETADEIVARLNLGLWTHLFNRRYEGILWPQLLGDVFPHIPRKIRTRKILSSKLNKFRRLRNRISHHEPIWNVANLPDTHREILEVIGWISPEMQSLVELIDRFPEVHARGVSGYENLIQSSVGSD